MKTDKESTDPLRDYLALAEIAESKGIDPAGVAQFVAELESHLAKREQPEPDKEN